MNAVPPKSLPSKGQSKPGEGPDVCSSCVLFLFFDGYSNRGATFAEEDSEAKKQEHWYSIFPVENEDLIYGRWEDDIIWDNTVRVIFSILR